jgi:hypothetical protein
MRLVPIMQPVEAALHEDDDPYVRPALRKVTVTSPANERPSGTVFTTEQSQANYIQSLLEHQNKRLQLLEEQMNRLEYNVNVKRASIRLREKDLYKRLAMNSSCTLADVQTSTQIDALIHSHQSLRDLKVEILCYVSEIDHFGEHYLGNLDVRKVVANSGRRAIADAAGFGTSNAAPPLPPRPPAKSIGQADSGKEKYSLLEMRVPTSVGCSGVSPGASRRKVSGDGSFNRSTSQGYSSMSSSTGATGGEQTSDLFVKLVS